MTDRQPEQQPTQTEKKATITLDSANSDPKYPAYQLSLNAMDGEHSGHGYRLMGPKYAGRSRNLRTVELTKRDADEIRKILDEVFPPKAVDETELAAVETHVVADGSDDPEHVDGCPGCEPATA